MDMFYKLLVIIAWLSTRGAKALSDDDTRVYLWAFMNITTDNSGLEQYQQLHISASIHSRFRLQIPYTAVDEYSFLSPGSKETPQWQERTYVVDLSEDHRKSTAFNAIRVTANNKIDIQASKVTKGSSDGFLVLPLTADSKEFYIPSYDAVPEGHSSFLVISPYKDTCVEASFINGTDIRKIFFRSLGEFEVYQAYSMTEDYTGVYVASSKPVAVFGGHECAQVPVGKKFCDHIVEQVPPITEWGKVFVIGPIIGRAQLAGYIIRIITSKDNTVITCKDEIGIDIEPAATIDRGVFKEFTISDNAFSTHCTCSERCLVVQYNTGYHAYDPNQDVNTDPWMTTITPQDHFTNYMTFSTMNFWADFSTKPFTSYITIVARTNAKSGIRLNNDALPDGLKWTDNIANSGYSTTAMPLGHGNYSLYHVTSSEKFVAYVYGHSIETNPAGYGYATGYDIQGPPLVEEIWDQFFTTTEATPNNCSPVRNLAAIKDRGLDLDYRLVVDLMNHATTPDCYYKYKMMLSNRINDLKDLINGLICVGVLCPNTTHTFIMELEISQYEPLYSVSIIERFIVDIKTVTSLDEPIGAVVVCKRSVIAFLQESFNWGLPLDVIGCPILDLNDVMIQREMYIC